MRNLLILVLLLLTVSFTIAQSETKIIAFKKVTYIGYMECEVKGFIKFPNADTNKYIYFSFPNTTYKSMKTSISFGVNDAEDSSNISKFIADITKAATRLGENEDILYRNKSYNIYVLSGKYQLSLGDAKTSESYTKLNAKEIDKLIKWLNELGFK